MITISYKFYRLIVFVCPTVPPETGGFIGIRNNSICQIAFDNGIVTNNWGTYRPDAIEFNNFIAACQSNKIEEFGIFHTHRVDQKDLSKGDKAFIQVLMNANPTVERLYFPIVIPKKDIYFYDAVRVAHKIKINSVVFKII